MTQPPKKKSERFFVEQVAKLLGKKWCLGPDREGPDFIVTEDEQQFGLEVSEIFTGPQSKVGSDIEKKISSDMKKKESKTQRVVNDLRRRYEQKENISLIVKFNGDMCAENMTAVLSVLDVMNLSTKPLLHHDIIQVDEGSAKLRVHVTRALRADWYNIKDRVGWVNCNPVDRITEVIEKKSKKLPGYKGDTGLDDIRLLVVANRIMNSGKLSLPEDLANDIALDVGGFHVVYFFSYPEYVRIFD